MLLSPFSFESGAIWRQEACRAIESLIGATRSISSIPLEGEDFWTGDPEVIDALTAHWPHPPCITEGFLERRAALGLDVADWTEIFDVEEVRATDFYEGVVRPHGLWAPLGMYTELPELRPCALWGLEPRGGRESTLTLLSFFFRDERTALRELDWRKAVLQLLVPALHAGMHAYVRARRFGARLGELLEQIDAPIAIYRRSGSIAYQNPALTMLLRRDAEREMIRGAILRAVRSVDDEVAMPGSKVRSGELGAVRTPEVHTRMGRYGVYATPVEAGTYGWPDLTLVVVERQGAGSLTARDLAATYHLTIREAQALELLRAGASTRQIAGTMRISLNTARRHIERSLTKLGVHSRVAALAIIDRGR